METEQILESKPSGRRRVRRFVIIGAGLVVLVGGTLLVVKNGTSHAAADPAPSTQTQDKDKDKTDEKAPIPVRVVEVGTGTVSSYITSTANLVAENQVKVMGEAEGRVATLLVEEGAYVERGQVLASLVRDEAEIAFNKAKLQEANARRDYERSKDLVDKELVSREEFDNSTNKHEIAQQELAEAKWRLDKTTIRAPFSGRLSERYIQLGQHVRPGDELFQITDLDPLIARIYLPERDILSLKGSREVRITLAADNQVQFAGRIRQISPVVDTETGTVKVTIEANSPPPGVRPGSFVTIDIVRETRPSAVLLPREAVVRELQKAHVFVAKNDLAEKRSVTLGLEENDWVEVVDGVEPGEQVVVAGQGGLKEGAGIKVLEPETKTEASGQEG